MALSSSKIGTKLVSQALGYASNNIPALCNSSLINRFSLWKPIAVNTNGLPLTISDIENANCGFTIPSIMPSVKGAVEGLVSSKGRWVYNKPGNGPCRIGDFRNYDHNASDNWVIVYGPTKSTLEISDDRDDLIIFRVIPNENSDTQVALKHIPLLKNRYLGVLIWELSSGPEFSLWGKINSIVYDISGGLGNQSTMIQIPVKETPWRVGDTIGVICGLFERSTDIGSRFYSLNFLGDKSDSIWNSLYKELRIIQYVPPFIVRYTVSWDFQMSVTSDGYFTLSSIKCTLYTKDNSLLNTAKTIQVRFLATGSTNNVWHTKTDVAYCQISQAANTTRTWTFTKTDSSRAKFTTSMGVIQVEVFNVHDNQKFVSSGVIRVYGSSQSAGLTLGTRNAV